MPNDDYIKRNDALNAVQECFDKELEFSYDNAQSCMNRIKTVPAADVEPKRKTGVWLEEEAADDGNWRYTCSVCGYADIQSRSAQVPFCWHCGSRMQKMDKDIEPPKETKDNETDTAL